MDDQAPHPWRGVRLWRIGVQVLGFIVGVGLLAWCLNFAWRGEDGHSVWDHFRHASPWLVVGLAGCTMVSLTANAATFWVAFRPRKDVGFWHMQWLNVLGNALNYLPMRPGMIARIAYHLRVDRFHILEIGATFAAVALVMLATAVSLGGATLLRPEFDLLWIILAAVMVLVAGVALAISARLPWAARYGRGFDQVLRRHDILWPLVALRVLDIAAYTGRLVCAMLIVEITVDSLTYAIALGIVAMLFGLFPIRIGFREAGLAAALAFMAHYFDQPEVGRATLTQLALIESAGEAMVYIPLGMVFLPWFRKRWREGRRHPVDDEDER